MGAIVDIDGFTKKYNSERAVDSLDLRVKSGEIFGFLGPNGAGKTTTIKTMMGLLSPTKGTVKIMGEDLCKDGGKVRSKIGYLPENIELYQNLTGKETLEFFADLREVPEGEVRKKLEQVDLLDAADKKVGKYSKGMVQRLAFAQAILGEPPLLILDEPTSGLDPEGTSKVKHLVKNYVKKNRTVFFSSHVLPNVQEVADRVGIIVKGKLRALDSVSNLRTKLDIPAKLKMVLSGDMSEVQKKLQRSSIVKKFSSKGNRFTILCDDDDKREVMKIIEDTGAQIDNFSTEEGNLEDIFMRFTGGE